MMVGGLTKARKVLGIIVCVCMVATVFGGVMNVSAQETPNVSNEIMFWDDFETDLSKWTLVIDPATTNLIERSEQFSWSSGYAPFGKWSSWFLPSEWSLRILSHIRPAGVAYVMSQTYSTADDYIIQFNFLLPNNINYRYKVMDDGNVLLMIEPNNELYAYDGGIPVHIATLSYPIWYTFEIKVHVTTNDYGVYLDGAWMGNFNTVSTPYNYLLLGDDSYDPSYFGEGFWDNVHVGKLHQLSWDDDFDDGNIFDWTTVYNVGNEFDVSIRYPYSPPFHLYMYGQAGSPAFGLRSYGFTPYYDLPPNRDYTIEFQFCIPDTNNEGVVAMADGYVCLVVDGNLLEVYIDEINIIPIKVLNINTWYPIELKVYPVSMNYDVYINSLYYGRFAFVADPMFKKAPSGLFMGVNHDEPLKHGEAYWDDLKVISNYPPVLEWTGEPNFISDGLHPEIGFADVTTFEYRIKYIDVDNDPPASGDPKVHINKAGVPIGGSPFIMSEVDPLDTTYTDGKLYTFSTILSDISSDYTYYFTASDIYGAVATPTSEIDAPDVIEFTGSESWWMFHHDEQHTGHSTSVAPDSARVMWTFKTNHWIRSNPAVADDRVFFASLDHNLYALDEFTGNEIWKYYTTSNADWSSPAVADGMVFIGCMDGKLHAVNEFTGTNIWDFQTAGFVESSPIVADGMVFFGSEDKKVYALDEYTGAKIWEKQLPGWGILSSPAVADGMVFVGTEHSNRIYALDEFTGAVEWYYQTGGHVYSSPAVADGMVFVGSYDNKIYALDEFTGSWIWDYETGGFIYSSPAVANGKVFIGSWDGKVYALNEFTGAKIWEFQTDGQVLSSPGVADGKVFVGSYDDSGDHGTLYVLDELTGAVIWDYPLTGATFWSTPSIADGMVFIGSSYFSPTVHSYLYAFV